MVQRTLGYQLKMLGATCGRAIPGGRAPQVAKRERRPSSREFRGGMAVVGASGIG
ncbi:hypothetical protein [Glutamicibacter sp. BW80]|uniref:hypothetical protein n=1 Tax=Glutamicibacter sp. BW80 TaxID=2024404 RepID=UPI0015966761|nr:hypothetical protein [Glutamicibacter sp. BW80]